MANTIIQIKRSSATSTPPNASLASGELAYSYSSNIAFIGTSDGLGVLQIGGKYWTDVAVAAFAAANAAQSSAMDYAYVNTATTAANTYAAAVGVAANTYANNTFLPLTGGTISNNLVISGNLTVSGETTYANTQSLLIGDNIFVMNADLPGGSAPSENAGMEINRGSSANVSLLWNETSDKWTFTNDGTIYLNIASNTDIESVGTAANTNAANASYLSTGTVPSARVSGSYTGITGVGTLTAGTWNADTITVPYGGTGLTTAANNGVIFGNITGAFRVTAAGTEGQVLQANADGTPLFGDVDGGTF